MVLIIRRKGSCTEINIELKVSIRDREKTGAKLLLYILIHPDTILPISIW